MKPPYTFLLSLNSTDVKEVVSTVQASPEKLKVDLNHVDGEPRCMKCFSSLKYISFQLNWKVINADGSDIGSDSGSQNF